MGPPRLWSELRALAYAPTRAQPRKRFFTRCGGVGFTPYLNCNTFAAAIGNARRYSLHVPVAGASAAEAVVAESAARIQVLVLAAAAIKGHQFVYVMAPGNVGDGKPIKLELAPGRPLLGQFGWVLKRAVAVLSCPAARCKARECLLTGETLPAAEATFTARPVEVMKETGVTHL